MQGDDLHLDIVSAHSQLVEFLSHRPVWLLTTSQRFLPGVALYGLDGITNHKEKVSVLLGLLEEAGPATWEQFVQCLCMECDLPLDLETQLMSSAREGFARCHHHSSSMCEKDVKRQQLDAPKKYRHLLMDSVRQRYGSRRGAGAGVKEQMQPLAVNQAFVNLVIRQSKTPCLKERMEKSREDVAGACKPEEYVDTAMKVSDLFCSVVPSGTTKVIFLFGKPGTGKTMLMHSICQKWVEGDLPQFLFTFLFEFRQLNLLKRKLTLKELLFDLFLQTEDSPEAVFQYLLENTCRTLIIFDGLDEFAANVDVSGSSEGGPTLTSCMSISEFFADVCHGKLLPGCTVLVTSRPMRLPDFLVNTVNLLAEIWGFDHEKIKEYASHYFRQHSFKEQAIAHLKNNIKLLSMCHVPALCYVVCNCLEYLLLRHQTNVELPQTMTQFYIKMLLIFINKQQGEHEGGEEAKLHCNRKAILGLCDLAMKGLEERKLVFYAGEIPERVKEFASLHGLLTAFEVKMSGTCSEVGYAFVHLSLQEFFAALCLMVSRRVDMNYLRKKFFLKSKWTLKNKAKTEIMESFHIFLSGLSSKECRTFLTLLAGQDEAWVQDKQDVILQFLKKLAATNLTGPKVIELCHCTFETQDLKVAQHIGGLLNFKYEFKNFRLTPLDMLALVFVMNLGQGLARLGFTGCLMDIDCLEILAGCKSVEHLSFRSRRYGDDFAAALSKSLRGMASLKTLDLQDNRIRNLQVKRAMDLFSRMEKLKKIDLSNNNLSLGAVLTLAEEVITRQNATELLVRKDTVIVYFSGPSGKVPRSLDLQWEEKKEHVIPTRQVKLWDEAVCFIDDQQYGEENQTPTTPQKIRLTDSRFQAGDLEKLCAILTECSSISELELNDNHISLNSVFFLAQSLSALEDIKVMDLSIRNNTFSPCCIVLLINSINLCERIRMVEVRLTDCAIGQGQIDEFCKVLEQHGRLAEVDLSRNRISQDGVLHLINAFATSGNTTEVQASIEEPWVHKESVMNLIYLAVQTCRNITEITICKDKNLFQLGIRFPHYLEKVESDVSRLNLCKPEIQHAGFNQRVHENCARLQELRWSHVELHSDEAEMLVRILLPLPELKKFGESNLRLRP
ncbi:protein NLRC5-like protein [Amazona aestiva]|uniref:Protein NLRC5-like protein n=1 Tax=Amazona aestiva TaxID=12930 RepID=A0A0Q3U0H2_AMAAE|nr:protein NLRC5-like protein [Amazona aestiva]